VIPVESSLRSTTLALSKNCSISARVKLGGETVVATATFCASPFKAKRPTQTNDRQSSEKVNRFRFARDLGKGFITISVVK
jgi:hypothetical protein